MVEAAAEAASSLITVVGGDLLDSGGRANPVRKKLRTLTRQRFSLFQPQGANTNRGHVVAVYPEDEDDRQAELVGDSDYEDDEYIQSVCTPVKKGQLYYEFKLNTRSVKPTILHFQLRNLVWATARHDVYLMSCLSALHWSPLTSEKQEVIDFEGHVAPYEKHQGNFYEGFYQTEVTTLAVKNNLLLAGGFHGELICKHMSLSPDGKIIAVVGDDPAGLLVDANTGKMIHELRGHFDYSFASAWNPDGRTFATGNQDKTCRIWDARNLSKSVAILGGNIGAIRSIRYTSDGKFLAMAEPADFIHIFDVESGYNRKQELDFFGEIAGMLFGPDTEVLVVGVHDPNYSSLLQFGRRQFYSYLDSAI
ncbi:hypothetical protein ACQ4PT_050584 [Festuca glaucescens]